MTLQSFLILMIMILLYTLQSLLCRKYSDHYPGDPSLASPVFTIVSGTVVAVVSLLLCGVGIHLSPLTLLLGLLNSLAIVLYNSSLIKASQSGSYSILMIFNIAGGIVIPLAVAWVAFGEQLSLIKILCISVVLFSVYLVSSKKQECSLRGSFWLACLLLALANGIYGSLLDCQQRLTGVEEKEEMVAVTFGFAALFSFVQLLIRQKRSAFSAMKQNRPSALYLLACSMTVASAIHLLVLLLDRIDLSILYTFDNSGVLILSVLCSRIFFKERLSAKNILGCITMCAALICMSLFG